MIICLINLNMIPEAMYSIEKAKTQGLDENQLLVLESLIESFTLPDIKDSVALKKLRSKDVNIFEQKSFIGKLCRSIMGILFVKAGYFDGFDLLVKS